MYVDRWSPCLCLEMFSLLCFKIELERKWIKRTNWLWKKMSCLKYKQLNIFPSISRGGKLCLQYKENITFPQKNQRVLMWLLEKRATESDSMIQRPVVLRWNSVQKLHILYDSQLIISNGNPGIITGAHCYECMNQNSNSFSLIWHKVGYGRLKILVLRVFGVICKAPAHL